MVEPCAERWRLEGIRRERRPGYDQKIEARCEYYSAERENAELEGEVHLVLLEKGGEAQS